LTDFKGRTALVTGAARGIGRATALSLAAAGASVVVADLAKPLAGLDYQTADASALDETVALITAAGGACVAAAVDVRDVESLRRAVALGVETFGGLDIVVANAGIAGWPKSTWEASEEEWDRMIGVTLTGTWNTCRAAIPAILETGKGGSIVLVSSTAAFRPVATTGHYSAAKIALVGLMKSLALELAPNSIRVNTLHPGGTATPMTENDAAEHWQATTPGVGETLELPLPIHRMEPEDIANAIRFLSSDEARYVTGSSMVVDGGALLR
jgi:SDR family mycofactocin-dependent oxidoreductase